MKQQNKIEYGRVKRLLELNNKEEITEQEEKERDRLIDEIYYIDTGFQNIINGKIKSYSMLYTGISQNIVDSDEGLTLEIDAIFYGIIHNLLLKFKGKNVKNPGAYLYDYLFRKKFNGKDLIDSYFESGKKKDKYYFIKENLGLYDDLKEDFEEPEVDDYATFEDQDKIYKAHDEKVEELIKYAGSTLYITQYTINKFNYYCKSKYKSDKPYAEARADYEKAREKKIISWQKYKQAAENRKTIYTYHPRSFQENLHNLATWQDYIRNLVIHKLSKKEKAIIILYYWRCESTKQIAQQLNITSNGVNKTKNRALHKLKNYILGDIKLIKTDYPDTPLDYYTYTYQKFYKKVV